MKVSVCCPSYKRPTVETIEYYPEVKIYVAPEEADEYRKANSGADIVVCDPGVQGNVSRVRNHILKTEWDGGADVVLLLDDDFKGLYYWEAQARVPLPGSQLVEMVRRYTEIAKGAGAFFWGVNCSFDKQFYREYSPFSFLSFVGGPFQCFLRGNECWYDERLPLKEDYDMTLQQINTYRKVLRVNKYYYIARQSEQEGGCATYRNRDRELAQVRLLQKKWGTDIVKFDENRRNHMMKREKKIEDYNPVIRVPIKGI